MKTLTCDQLAVLRWMDERNIGAVTFEGSYRFPVAFRADENLATRFYNAILSNSILSREKTTPARVN